MTVRLGSVLLRAIASWDGLANRLRPPLLRRAGVIVGSRALIMSGVRFAKFSTIMIGDDVYINHDCYFDAEADITIGAHTSIADHVRFVTATHEIGRHDSRAGAHHGKQIVVGAGCWIGSGVVILPGVVVGAGCIVAAGAVVNRDCAPDALYAGVPATLKRSLPTTDDAG